jgi:serine/threonine protein kinase
MTELIGQVLNGYSIKSKLGSGGQSVVYLASHDNHDEEVAVRYIRPEFANDEETIKRFQTEAVIFFRLKHPNIVHRDIKPDNILFDNAGIAYVHDFGVAKRLKHDAITRADVMIGSPAYLSPEQIT